MSTSFLSAVHYAVDNKLFMVFQVMLINKISPLIILGFMVNPHCLFFMRNVPCGSLALRFSKVCPDACDLRISSLALLMCNPGLIDS